MQTAVQSWNSIGVSASNWSLRLMPGLTDVAFLLPALFLFLKLPGTKILFADGDTGWHIRTGEWILQHHAVPRVDMFSFTKPHAPWFAWEWGWDILFAFIHSFSGLAGVGFTSVLVLGLASLLLYKLTIRACGNELLGFAVTVIAVCGTALHWLARPHLFSWVFFLLFLHLLRDAEEGRGRALYWLPGLTLLWTNMHGAFFVGIVLVVTAALGEALKVLWVEGELPGSRGGAAAALRAARPYLLCAIACAAATFVNPYTWHLHQHIVEYLRDSQLLDSVQEFQSMNFRSHPGAIFFEGMLAAGLGAAFWLLRSLSLTPAINILLWAHLALLSTRNIPFFMLVAAAPVTALLQSLMQRASEPSGAPRLVRGFFSTIREICEELRPFERVRRFHLVSVLAVLGLGGLFAVGAKGFEGQFDPDVFPQQALPLIESSAAKHIFTYDQWGDYLIYKLYPSRQVFVDGRMDFYGNRFSTDYVNILNGHFDWRQQLSRFSVDMVIIKPDLPLSTALKAASGWKLLFDDGKILVFEQYLGDAKVRSLADGAPVKTVLR